MAAHASVKQRAVSGSLKILIPLYATYLLFALGIFFFFVPQQRHQLTEQKKEAILNLTESVVSLLTDYASRVKLGELSPRAARQEAISQIRSLRYGTEGKDYFWINDYHPFMIMHPYRPDLEGRDLTLFKDRAGNYPFMAMVDQVMGNGGGYVNYQWQWKDTPEKIMPKISYVKGFPDWGWIIGTGIYQDDIEGEMAFIAEKFYKIFAGILVFVVGLSIYISFQVFRIEQRRNAAEQARQLDQLRLKKLFDLSQLTGKSQDTITEFAVEEAIDLTKSQIGYLAFLSEDETLLTMHTWSEKAMTDCRIKDKTLVYQVADTGLWARAARTRKPDVINDYPGIETPEKKGCPQGHVGILRMMSIPVFEGGRIVALAGVGNKPSPYDRSDIRQLQLMMDGMWKILRKSRAEVRLRESEARYRILADNATDVIWILELDRLKTAYVSPAVQTLLGYSPEEYRHMEMADYIHGASLDRVFSMIAEELARDSMPGVDQNRYRVIELDMKNSRGETIRAEVTARFLRTPEGHPDRILGITRDISQRKALEKQLRQANTDLSLAQRISGIGSWSFDTQTGRHTWSREIYRIFERSPEQAPGSPDELESLYMDKWREIHRTAFQDAMQHGISYDIELKLSLPSGREKWIHSICNPETGTDGTHYMLRGTVQDITERKVMEDRIRQTQKLEALGTLAGGIAHDFNNILSSMMGFTELAKLRAKHSPDITEKLDHILEGGLRARDLIKHILAFSRKADIQKSKIEMGPLLKECLKFLRASLPPDITICQNLSDTRAVVLTDPTQMHQVLMNLFTNAAYAMKETGGTLDIGLTSVRILENEPVRSLPPGQYLKLTVGDTGPGIPKSTQAKIFEPFFTTKPRGEGSGMGLSMVYGIVSDMKGSISVYSEPGMGTTFQILLPVAEGETDLPPAERYKGLISGNGRILLVDDESPIIKWTTLILLNLGYEVRGFEDPLAALGAFTRAPDRFDLVLTDLAMPGMTGMELAEKIKGIRPDLPIVICTGFSENLTPKNLKRQGIADMVMKPMIAAELAQAVHSAITKPSGETP